MPACWPAAVADCVEPKARLLSGGKRRSAALCASVRQALCAGLLMVGLLTVGASASPQVTAAAEAPFPAHPLRLVVTFGPGGVADISARLLAPVLSRLLRQPVVVENRSGAGGAVGALAVARAAPDGYTLLLGTPATQVLHPLLVQRPAYDAAAAFRPVSLLAAAPLVVAVRADGPIGSLGDLVQRARVAPDALSFGSAGVGTAPHLAMLVFQQTSGAQLRHIPYRSGAEALQSLLAGDVDVVVEAAPVLGPFIAAGRLRALAAPQARRLAAWPVLPTTAEAGLPDFVVASPWTGIAVPAGTPDDRVARLRQAMAEAMRDASLRGALQARGLQLLEGGPAAYEALLLDEQQRWTALIRASGLSARD